MPQLLDRMIRAARLDVNLYEEVEADTGAMTQAMTVVLITAVAAGLGSWTKVGFKGLIVGAVAALVSWFVWAFLTWYIGTKMLPEPQTSADVGELLRTIGFASSPGVIRIVGIIPGLWSISNLVASLWMLVAMVIAVRQALDYQSTWRAVGVCLIGFVAQVVIMMLFGLLVAAF